MHNDFEEFGPLEIVPPRDLRPPLVIAVLDDDVDDIKIALKNGQDVNIVDRRGNTPLHLAVQFNRLEAFDHLLTVEGVAIDSINRNRNTPLHLACKKRRTTSSHFIRQLVNKGAKVNTEDCLKDTPLLAAISGHMDFDVISLLVQHGSHIEHQNRDGHSALHVACSASSAQCVSALLYWGAHPLIYDRKNKLPFDLAIEEGAHDVVDLLFPYCFDCRSIVEVRLNTVICAMWYKYDVFQDLVDARKLRITFDEDDLRGFRGHLWFLEPEWLKRFVGPLYKVWEALFRLDDTWTLGNYLVNQSRHWDSTKLARNLLVLFSDETVGPMVVELLNTHRRFGTDMIQGLLGGGLVDPISDYDDIAVQMIYCMLSHGVDLTALDLVAVYQRSGFCNLFRDLLLMDIVDMDSKEYEQHEALIPGIFLNLRHDVEYYMSGGKFVSKFRHYNIGGTEKLAVCLLKELLGLFADSRLYEYVLKVYDNNKVLVAMATERRFPSLLELSRNASREYILQVFKVGNTRQYYTILDRLPLAQLHKDVLLFKEPIYIF